MNTSYLSERPLGIKLRWGGAGVVAVGEREAVVALEVLVVEVVADVVRGGGAVTVVATQRREIRVELVQLPTSKVSSASQLKICLVLCASLGQTGSCEGGSLRNSRGGGRGGRAL